MWFDWGKITLLDSVMFSILCVLTLYLVGFGILRLILTLSKKTDPFVSFDFVVKANFRIIFGFIFIFLSILIFSFFNLPFIVSTLSVIAFAVVGFAVSFRNLTFKLPKINLRNYATILAVLVILIVTIFLSSMLISGFFGSTNDDGADHTLMTRIILDNPNALLTRISQPFASFWLSYPSGSHVLCGFFLTLLNVPIQKIVMLVSAILPSLIALSFYSIINCLFKNKVLSILGLIVASFFTIGLSWAPLFWAGLPLLLSFYVSINGLGLIYVFLLEDKMIWLNASLLGLVFFISLQTYPVSALMLGFWFLLILIFKFLPRVRNIWSWKFSVSSFFNRRNMTLLMSFFAPILFSVPYLFSYYANNVAGSRFQIVTSSLTSVSNVTSEIVKTKISFNWVFDVPALWAFFSEFGKLLSIASISLFLIFILFISMRFKTTNSTTFSKRITKGLLLIYLFNLIIMSYLSLTLFLDVHLFSNLFDPERVWQHIFIPATIMTAVAIFSAIYFGYLAYKRLFFSEKKSVTKITKTRILVCVVLVLVILLASFAIIPAITDQQSIYKKIGLSFNTFETLRQDDLSLMKWITENVPSQARILVSAGDSGQFVTPVTQRYTISRYSYLANYSDLMTLLTSNSSDLRAVPLLVEYNVSYVYVGSTATIYALQNPYNRHFNTTQFFATSYFTLAKEVGDAWLFQFNQTAALSAFNIARPA